MKKNYINNKKTVFYQNLAMTGNFSILLIILAILLIPTSSFAARRIDFYCQSNSLLDIKDPVGDDKGNGYFQYPLDKRLKRGTYDIKSFRVYEESDVVIFVIQMRNYIMRTWEDTGKSDDQGFVANLWDIYVDIDGIENSGYNEALPGRGVLFADKMGWEKMVLISPMNFSALEEILREKTDELDFQDRFNDIIVPDYVEIQGDKIITKIAKKKLPRISNKSGFQCFSMGYKNVVSGNRLLNRDVKAFPTHDDFGGGSNDYGEPTIIDMIVPNDENQYKLLRNFTTASYADNIRYAEVPFVYANGNRMSPAVEALRRAPLDNREQAQQPVVKNPQKMMTVPVMQPVMEPVNQTPSAPKETNNGFMPLKKNNTENSSKTFNTPNTSNTSNSNIPSGFVPVKKNK